MQSGTKQLAILKVDGKGRVHLPIELRKRMKIEDQLIAKEEKNTLVMKPIKKIEDPVAFLSSIKFKTKKSPKEMKREAEALF